MKILIIYLFKIIRRFKKIILKPFDFFVTYFLFMSNGVNFSNFKTNGIPLVNVTLTGHFDIGNHFKMNSRESSNPIGRFNKCSFFIGKKASLIIGNNVGISSSSIVCHFKITIEDNVKLGGNVVIYDTDFHSLNALERTNKKLDSEKAKRDSVVIQKNVFIGAHSTILKGVTIGENSIIGACSVVSKSIPKNEIWAGNPAKFIRKIRVG